MQAILTENLSKFYGKQKGIEKLNLSVNKGEIYGFVGKNGAGKSTAIRCLLNFIQPTGGSCQIFGLDCVKETKAIKHFTSYIPGEVKYYGGLKVTDLFSLAESFCGKKNPKRIKQLCDFFELDVSRYIADLSLGNRKKAAIVQALIKEPKLIILDEPTSGLDPLMQAKFFEILQKERDKGATIFLSSHNLAEVEKHCDKVAIIKQGELATVLSMQQAQQSRKLVAEYETEGKIFKEILKESDINKLIEKLSKLKLTRLEIKHQSLEEEIIHLYDSKEERYE